jgi:arylsulfatase A-like enzyme
MTQIWKIPAMLGRRVLTFGLMLHIALLTSCEKAADQPVPEGPSVLVVVMGSFRADHIGQGEGATPFLDELVSEGVSYTNAIANSSARSESLDSLLNGVLPSVAERDSLSGAALLAGRFSKAGYRTGYFALNDRSDEQFSPRSFGESDAGLAIDGELIESAVAFAGDKPSHPYFACLYIPRNQSVFGATSGLPEVAVEGAVSRETLRNRYESALTKTDSLVKSLIEGLRAEGALDDTIVVVTADHGEEILEHASVGRGWTLYEESIRVPLVFWSPDRLNPALIDQRVSLVDVAPSLAALTELGAAKTSGDTLFAKEAETWEPVALPRRTVISELLDGGNLQRSMSVDGWKYIASYRWVTPGERLTMAGQAHYEEENAEAYGVWGRPLRDELYDLNVDTGEMDNLFESNRDQARLFRKIAYYYQEECGGTYFDLGEGSNADEVAPESTMEELESLGYL